MVDEIRGSTSHAIAEMVPRWRWSGGSVMAEKAGSSIVEINDGVARVLNGVEIYLHPFSNRACASRAIAVQCEKSRQMSDENSEAVRDVFGTVEIFGNALQRT